ncbi:MAG: Glyoxalase/bleomycin resistance protein/dioxygenase [Devosia sp.]|uniref:VOC family protein n=1 Tax=Devosia sp. TaxID=1871048 RepID=UPI002628BABD|nr:VOC family protein [Devosia sp.]MDB5529873.1 Glyoxalase/bleomycin resistance protein/dioxygenase [Devosia sp.]
MNLISIRIITADPKPLVAFYAAVTGIAPTWFTEDFAELATPSGTLAIASTRTLALFGDNIARPAANASVIVEFITPDVDADFVRLAAQNFAFEQSPTTMPWGNRSALLRDPDGNLVNLFTPVSAQARQKFGLAA